MGTILTDSVAIDRWSVVSSMADSFTVLWTNDWCDRLKKHGATGQPLCVLFGGAHQSAPSFTRFGVEPGDFIYPVGIRRGRLSIIARMKVGAIVSVEDYLRGFLSDMGIDPYDDLSDIRDPLLKEHPELEHRIPRGCVYEAALAEPRTGTPIRFDVAVPPHLLERLRFRSRRGERGLKYVEDGLLKRPNSLQGGVYRLSLESAGELERLVQGATAQLHQPV
jgi:hypothetical protein